MRGLIGGVNKGLREHYLNISGLVGQGGTRREDWRKGRLRGLCVKSKSKDLNFVRWDRVNLGLRVREGKRAGRGQEISSKYESESLSERTGGGWSLDPVHWDDGRSRMRSVGSRDRVVVSRPSHRDRVPERSGLNPSRALSFSLETRDRWSDVRQADKESDSYDENSGSFTLLRGCLYGVVIRNPSKKKTSLDPR